MSTHDSKGRPVPSGTSTRKTDNQSQKAIAAGQAAHERLCASSDPIIASHAKTTGHLGEREPLTIIEALRRQAGKVEDIARGKRGSDSGLRAAGRADGLREAAAMVASWVGVLPVVERTPETVLRAMLVSYSDAIVASRGATLAEDDLVAYHRTLALRRREHAIQDSLALVLSGEDALDLRSLHDAEGAIVAADYAARLSGTAPIDAPPAKS